MKQSLASVVIPIYNAQKFLKQAIDSVVGQTYPYFELLLIDDGSTDKSLSICLDYEKRDDRIKVLTKKNEGILKTRLYALSQCTGEYICFIDADDWVIPDYLKILVDKATEYNADVVCINTYKTLDRWGFIKLPFTHYQDAYLTELELEKYHTIYPERLFTNCCWGKLYKKELFEQVAIEYIPIHHGDDAYINLMLSPFIRSVYFTNVFGYYYRFGGSTKNFDDRFWKDCCTLYREQKKFALRYYPPHIEHFARHLQLKFCANIELMICFSSSTQKEIIQFIESVFNSPIYSELTAYPCHNAEIDTIFTHKDALHLYHYLKDHVSKRSILKHKVIIFLSSALNGRWL